MTRDLPKLHKRWVFGVLATSLLLAIYELFFDRAVLVDPMPIWATVLASIVGSAVGIRLILAIAESPQSSAAPLRFALTAIFLPIFMAIFFNHPARLVYEAIAFTGIAPQKVRQEAVIVGKSQSRRIPIRRLEIQFGSRGRSIAVPATDSAYFAAEPYHAPGAQCILMNVHQGRFGIKRVLVPAHIGDKRIGEAQIDSCSDR
ncbi:MAG: hypothetical protein SFV20_14370 [Sphingopyxis sp.]|nr:hypothetical protein [Sphingopyxis sp.]